MGNQLKIYSSQLNPVQSLELQNILDESRAIFSADGQRQSRGGDFGDTLSELVRSAPGGSYKKALEESLEPGAEPLLRPYDHVAARVPGFELATVNLSMLLRAVDRSTVREGKHNEILILDKKFRYYEATVRHQVSREDPNEPIRYPNMEQLEESEYRITERFKFSDNPEGVIEHALGIIASGHSPLGELDVDDTLSRLSEYVGSILGPVCFEESGKPKKIDNIMPESLSA